ncbi:MAG: hypothetical protein JSV08_05465 [Acidobacteriota bacterium]|nr:MAG: hypothetical protein JSV08_05465 [Acidobacteriota bacterium]
MRALEKRASLAAIGIAVLVFFAMARKADEPLRDYGAGWDEALALTAGEHFARDGFLKHRLAPYLQISPLEATPPAYRVYYVHSQPLSFLTHGLLRRLGMQDIAPFRWLGSAVYALGVVAFFVFLRMAVSAPVALLATWLCAWTPTMYLYGDSLTFHSYVPIFLFAPLALWLHLENCPQAGKWGWPLLWLLLVLQMLYTQHTYAIYSQLFFWSYVIAFRKKWSWRKFSLLLSAPAAATALILARNAWLLGWHDALWDIVGVVVWRMFEWEAGPYSTMKESHFAIGTLLSALAKRMIRDFGVPLAAAGAAAGMARRLSGKFPATPDYACRVRLLALALFVPALLYAAAFQEEIFTHGFHLRNFAPAFCLLAAWWFWKGWKRSAASEKKLARTAAAMLGIIMLACTPVRMLRKEARHTPPFQEERALAETLPRNAVCIYSWINPTLIRYVNRPYAAVASVPDGRTYYTETIPTMERLLNVCEEARRTWGGEHPMYFVLFKGRPETVALRKALSESEHRLLWTYEAVEVYRLDCERLAAEPPPRTEAPRV